MSYTLELRAPCWVNADQLALGLGCNTLKVTATALACSACRWAWLLALMRLSPRRCAGLAGGRGDRGLPHHAATGAAVLVLLRAAHPAGRRDDALRRPPRSPSPSSRRPSSPRSSAAASSRSRPRPVGSGARDRHESTAQTMRRVVLPQAVKRMIPAFHGTRHRADEDHHAGGHRELRRPAVPGQRGGAEDLPSAGGLHRRGAALLHGDLRRQHRWRSWFERRLAASGEGTLR